jgi:hypothetical protein
MHLGSASASILVALLALLAPHLAAADYDLIPEPPPRSVDAPLPGDLQLEPSTVTVSGLSSGAFFAHQFHVAFSDLVHGAGIIAGGPFGCVDVIPNPFWPGLKLDRFSAAVLACTHYYGNRFWGLRPSTPDAEDAKELVDLAHEAGEIADPALLADDRVWLLRGELDEIVPAAVAESLSELYRALGIGEEALRVEIGDPERLANHGMPVETFPADSRFDPVACAEHEPPFIIDCDYDAAGLLLRHLYPEGWNASPVDPHEEGTLRAFDQTPFFLRSGAAGLSGVGYVHVPTICRSGSCRLHVAFHGCRQHADNQEEDRVHDDFVRDAGYNRWAAANRIVVLYPQATRTALNPNGCWDFWGHSGQGWRTRDGVQMRAAEAMINSLIGR